MAQPIPALDAVGGAAELILAGRPLEASEILDSLLKAEPEDAGLRPSAFDFRPSTFTLRIESLTTG